MKYEFSEKDLIQIQEHGLTAEAVLDQLARYKQGFPKTQVTSAIKQNNGIRQLQDEEVERLGALYEEFAGTSAKFVPASGAATRMFKSLFDYLKKPQPEENPFLESLSQYPFADALKYGLQAQGVNMLTEEANGNYAPIIRYLLEPGGLNYAALPKALIPMHKVSKSSPRTALEEHLVEGALYAKTIGGSVNIHFTLSEQHKELVPEFCHKVAWMYEEKYGVRYNLTWSVQNPATDTIAATMEGEPYRNPDGTLLFRPAGHGALLENLQSVSEEIIFIKNIDNVAPDSLKNSTVRYKKCLAGILIQLRNKIYNYVERLHAPDLQESECDEMIDFCRLEMAQRLPVGIENAPVKSKCHYLKTKLNRPIRICGVVKNEGDPGGGPFWVRERDGSESLQIVETSQMDLNNPRVQDIVSGSKFFNPVDIVCSIKDYKGEKFNLQKYVNKNTGFIAHKSVNGTPIQAIELPGLWNGGMADWNTIFVEVPSITFTPVKEVTDLIRPEHQA